MKAAKQARVDLVLDAMPGTTAEIAAKSGLGVTTVRRWVSRLLKANEVHVYAEHRTIHEHSGGPIVASYDRGPDPGKLRRLKPFTRAESSARYRKSARADGRWDLRLARYRARGAADRASFARDPLLAGLFGTPKPREQKDQQDGKHEP